MKDVFIVAAKRTPIGSFGGQFLGLSAIQLGIAAVKGAVAAANLNPDTVEEFIFGNVCSANLGQAPARQVALGSGLPASATCTTVNKVCASGMKSTALGAQSIQLGLADVVVTGGMESMSNIPFYLEKARYGYGYGSGQVIDGLEKDGLRDAYQPVAMGCFADATAAKFELSREMQDEFAIHSYKKAAAAWSEGIFGNEVVAVELTDRKGNVSTITEDEEYKKVNFDKIPSLRPVFTKEGTVTAANASTINDGAAALVLASAEAVEKHGLKPLARIVATADAEQAPEWFTTAPIAAAELALKRAGLSKSDIDFYEVNEAFSAVTLAFIKGLEIPAEKVNVFGGAVAIGHPLGCSGARILVTLQNVLQTKNGRYGLAAICNGGGGASAMIIERLS